jgi:Zn-dependent metalloprotease
MLRFFTILIVLFSCLAADAQVYEGSEAHRRLQGAEIVRVSSLTGRIQYALLSGQVQVNHENAVEYLQNVFGLKSPYGLKLLKQEDDQLGFAHRRYQQTYNGIPLLGGVLIAHFRNGRLHSFNGEIFETGDLNSKSKLPERQCLEIALDSVGAEIYMWQVPEEEIIIKDIKQDMRATWYPKGELMYCPAGLDFSRNGFFLTYRFTIHGSRPRTAENIYINAITGELVARENLLHTTDVPGKANTKYSGTKTILTDSTSPNNYRLRENTRGGGIYTFNLKKGTNYGSAVDFKDSNNIWNNVNVNKDEVATDAHWGAETTFDYYKFRHNRSSYNNNNARINSYVHYSSNFDNAFWDGVRMTYGDGSAFKPLTSLDVCGHEITHAVTSNSAGLIYSYESGQLNESFSDIFGNAIERYGKPANYSWIIGEEITNDGLGLRNMINPKLKGHPRCYKSINWYSGSGDNGGVHLNSGVQNWWFYLVCEGGAGTNDVLNNYKVDSIGILKGEKIAYRNLTVYLTPSSQYADARFYSIRAAVDLYGNCSREVISVTNAWHACNVGARYDSGTVKADFIADTIICNKSTAVKFTNLSTNSGTAKWTFGDGAGSSLSSPAHTYSAYSTYSIKLVVNSCFKNRKDSISRNAYVKVDSTFDICNSVLLPAGGSDSTSRCQTFVYDEGGLGDYKNQTSTIYRLSAPGADSVRIRFLDFDYEEGFDSLYIYKGKFPGGVKIGGFTGSSLPFAGKNFSIAGSMITLRHVADPGVVGRGFKMFYTAIKKPVDITAFRDTMICKGNSTLLYAKGSGGYFKDYIFQWKGIANNDSITVAPAVLSTYKVFLTDVCTKSKDSAELVVQVRNPLELKTGNDTSICSGQSVNLYASASGGRNSSYKFTWNNGLGNAASHKVNPSVTTTYRVILSDGCTPVSDTAYVTIKVKNPLKVKLTATDSTICYKKTASLSATGYGGDSINHLFTWNNGLGNGPGKSISLNGSTWIKVTLTDGCTVNPASDSLLVNVLPELKVEAGNDTAICLGNGIKLNSKVTGGDVKGYSYTWSGGLPSLPSFTVSPVTTTKYFITVKDKCSDQAMDSITVSVLPALSISGLKDTTICSGGTAVLDARGSGGRTASHSFEWDNGHPKPTLVVTPKETSMYMVVLSDGCTQLNDQAFVTVTVREPLSVRINTADTHICYNKSSKLTVSGSGGIAGAYVYNWNSGLGTGNNKTLQLSGNALVKVSLTDACSADPAADSVWIKVRQPLSVSLGNDTAICSGTDIRINSKAKGGDVSAYKYIWTQGLGNTASHIVTPGSKLIYRLTLRDNCSDDATDSVEVDVLKPLKIAGLRDTTICYGGTASLVPSASGGKTSQYVYSWDNGLSGAGNQFVSPVANTTYRLVLKDNCSNPSAQVDIKVTVRPALIIGLSVSDTEICDRDSVLVRIRPSGGIPAKYKWSMNGLSYSSGDVYVNPNLNTSYTVKLYDNCSWDTDTSFDIKVNPLPKADFAAGFTSVCAGRAVQFSNNSSNAVNYEWNFNTGDKSSVVAPVYIYKSPGTYAVTLRAVSSEGCTDVLTRDPYITVVAMPASDFSYDAVSVTYDHPLVTFSNKSTDYTSFEWDFGDNITEGAVPDPSHMYSDTGHFSVRLITRNLLGCSDTMLSLITVSDIYKLFIPTAISVNGDGLNDELRVGGRGVAGYKIRIFNRWGELVFTGTEKDKPFNGKDVRDKNLAKGSYVLTAEIKDHLGRMHYIRQVLQIL